MKHKVSELEGGLLDIAVARSLGMRYANTGCVPRWFSGLHCSDPHSTTEVFEPTRRWEHGGPIIQRERVGVWPTDHLLGYDFKEGPTQNYCAELREQGRLHPLAFGPTPLIAAMRAYVASKLGEEVEL